MESNQLRGHVGAALHLVHFGASGVSQTKQRGTLSIGRSGLLTETFPMPQSQTSSLLFDVVKIHRNAHRYRYCHFSKFQTSKCMHAVSVGAPGISFPSSVLLPRCLVLPVTLSHLGVSHTVGLMWL